MKLVEPIQIVKLDQMIPQFVNVNKTTSETHFKAAEENANLQETVHNPKSVNDSNVFQYVEKEVRDKGNKNIRVTSHLQLIFYLLKQI